MFETLETRQFLSATQITDGTSNTVADAAEAPAQKVYVSKSGGDQQAYMDWKLKEVLISGVIVNG
jgi:hypothetical protein